MAFINALSEKNLCLDINSIAFLALMVQTMTIPCWFFLWLGEDNTWQHIEGINDNTVHWLIYAWPGHIELDDKGIT